MPTIDQLGSNGTLAPWGEGFGGYYGQTFAALAGALSEIQFEFAGNSGNTDYKVYIVTWTGAGPGSLLWQSPLPLVGSLASPSLVTISIPGLHLDAGTKYAFILDTAAGVLSGSSVGSVAALDPFVSGYGGGYAGGEFFFSTFETGTVAGDLARTPIILGAFDLAFKLTFSEFVNSPPAAHDDIAGVVEDQAVTGNLLANDSDPDVGDILVVTGLHFGAAAGAVGTPLHGLYGTLTVQANGSYSYAADADLLDTLTSASGLQDIFTYDIADGAGGAGTASLTVNVSLADDAHTLIGTNQPDTIFGDRNGQVGAEDTIFGGNAVDRLFGLDGADVLHGDQGNDILAGGAGPDSFVFAKSGGDDIVVDFQHGVDHVVLDGIKLRNVVSGDVDHNGVGDLVLNFSSGSATLLNVGNVDVSGDIVAMGALPFAGGSLHFGSELINFA